MIILLWSEFNERYFSIDPTMRWQQHLLPESGFTLSNGKQTWRVEHHLGAQSTCTLIKQDEVHP
jgi:hypothetical protein